jgi:hypothetical protein
MREMLSDHTLNDLIGQASLCQVGQTLSRDIIEYLLIKGCLKPSTDVGDSLFPDPFRLRLSFVEFDSESFLSSDLTVPSRFLVFTLVPFSLSFRRRGSFNSMVEMSLDRIFR